MSENKHTPEPWIAIPGGRHDPEMIITTQHRLAQSYGEICGMDVEFTGKHGEEQKANARRIVACVNACAALDTDALEIFGLAALGKELAILKKQRDDLLSVLRRVAWEAASYSEAVEIAKSAICETGILPPKPAIASVKGSQFDVDCDGGSRAGYECPVCRQCDCRGCATSDHSRDATQMNETSAPAIVFYPAGSLGEYVESEGGES